MGIMRILIVGAGGVGGFFGAWLLHAQRDVTFLVRPQRASQLRMRGLQLTGPGGDLQITHPPTVTAATLTEHFDLIILSCKAWDLQSAIQDFAPAVGPETAILPLLNGMNHMEILDWSFGRQRVLGGETNVSTVKEPGGRIVHLNRLDALDFGDRDDPDGARIHAIADVLTVPGYSAHLRHDIQAAMWQKWVAIATAVGATCLFRATIGDIVAAGQAIFVEKILLEACVVASAAGYPPPSDYIYTTLAKFTQVGSNFTASMFRDMSAGGPIERQQIVGDLIGYAQRLGLEPPLLEVVHAHLRCYEERRDRELVSGPTSYA
jgi:2-dehydropantoate 2-reductase